MRLAGAYYIKPGQEPIQSTIINNSSKVYTYEELRAIIPEQPSSTLAQSWKELEQDFRLPVPERVPLIECLSRANRLLIKQGTTEGQRNDRGYALACDLIGASNYLNRIGQSFDSTPRILFEQYCTHCLPPLENAESESIWQSAEKRSTGSSLPSSLIENCIKGWFWRDQKARGSFATRQDPSNHPTPSTNEAVLSALNQNASILPIHRVQAEVLN